MTAEPSEVILEYAGYLRQQGTEAGYRVAAMVEVFLGAADTATIESAADALLPGWRGVT